MAEPIETRSVSRRTVLKGVAGVAGLASVPADRGVRPVWCVQCGERGSERRGSERRSPQRRGEFQRAYRRDHARFELLG